MPAKRPRSNRKTTDRAPADSPRPIDIDDAAIDETASVQPDEDLVELANPDDQPAPKSTWRERDADRRAHGDDDLKA